MAASITTGVVVSRFTRRPIGLSRDARLALGLGAFCGGMLGAKLPFVLADWDGFLSGTAWLDNGKTIVLGLVGGYFGVEAVKWALGIEVKTGDGFAAPVAAAVAVGRLACFARRLLLRHRNGPALGRRLPRRRAAPPDATLRVRLPRRLCRRADLDAGARHVPLPAHEALHHRVPRLPLRHRVHPPRAALPFGLTAYQWAALAFAPVFAALWWWDGRRVVR